jgi:hypothetical protein
MDGYRLFVLHKLRRNRGDGIPPWPVARVALSHTKGLHLLNRKLLRDVDNERHPLFSLTAVETDHGKQATGRQLSRFLATVRVVSSEAPAP